MIVPEGRHIMRGCSIIMRTPRRWPRLPLIKSSSEYLLVVTVLFMSHVAIILLVIAAPSLKSHSLKIGTSCSITVFWQIHLI